MNNEDLGRQALSYAAACLGRYTEQDGADYLISWANSAKSFDMVLFSGVCREFAEKRRNSDKARKPTIHDLVNGYNRKVTKTRRDGETSNRCDRCGNTGYHAIVIGGDSLGSVKPVKPTAIVALWYAVSSLVPCDCSRGKRNSAGWNEDTAKLLRTDYAFDSRNKADTFAFECRKLWQKENGVIRAESVATEELEKEGE